MSAFEDFRSIKDEMSLFTDLFQDKVTATRNIILQAKQEFETSLSNKLSQQAQLQTDIKNLKIKEIKIKDSINKSLENLQIQQLRVNDLESKQVDLTNQRDGLQATIDGLNEQTRLINENLQQTELDLKKQDLADYPELIKYELYLGLRIEVLSVDLLKFIFNNIDSNDIDREVWCDLSVGGDLYKIGETFPKLDPEVVQLIEDDFNSHKEFVKFLKTIRMKLKDLILG